jgi:hypothetical protein
MRSFFTAFAPGKSTPLTPKQFAGQSSVALFIVSVPSFPAKTASMLFGESVTDR